MVSSPLDVDAVVLGREAVQEASVSKQIDSNLSAHPRLDVHAVVLQCQAVQEASVSTQIKQEGIRSPLDVHAVVLGREPVQEAAAAFLFNFKSKSKSSVQRSWRTHSWMSMALSWVRGVQKVAAMVVF